MSERYPDQEFIEYIIKGLVENPDDVRTERTIDEMGVLITLYVNQKDMGKVIGRSGNTARSVRTILRVFGAKNNARINLKIYEPEHMNRQDRMQANAGHDDFGGDLKL